MLLQGVLQKFSLMKPTKTRFCILDDISGTLRPGRITLLLGPPGAGKSTLLNALAGRLQKTAMHVSDNMTLYWHFCNAKTAALLYISA